MTGKALDQLMPMHLWLDPSGRVIRAGPTLVKIAGGHVRGLFLFDILTVERPRNPGSLDALKLLQGVRLGIHLNFRPDLPLRGIAVELSASGGLLINLSLGLSFAKAVEDCGLTLTDFSPCDQSVDLLYLREANLAIACESRDLTERLQEARQAAEERALTDPLTGLANRRAMDMALRSMTCEREPRFGLMQVDLDFFKEVNDTLGHAAGDHVLAHAASVLRSEIRNGDVVARVGGDEFVLLLRDCDDPDLLDAIGTRLISRLEEPVRFEGTPCRISASAGSVLASRYDEPSPDRMLSDADIALYASKNRGRAQHTLFSDALLAPMRPT